MALARGVDPHERPPTLLRDVYKYYRKLATCAIEVDPKILDFSCGSRNTVHADGNAIVQCGMISKKTIAASCCNLADTFDTDQEVSHQDAVCYEVKDLPG